MLPLVVKENWWSAHFCRIFLREKEVACKGSAMHILHFYFVGQIRYSYPHGLAQGGGEIKLLRYISVYTCMNIGFKIPPKYVLTFLQENAPLHGLCTISHQIWPLNLPDFITIFRLLNADCMLQVRSSAKKTPSHAKKTPLHPCFCSHMCIPIYLSDPPGVLHLFLLSSA